MGYITLISDLGSRDASVASAKGMLLQHIGAEQIIDISHEVAPFDLQQAAYLLASAYRNFPAGTCHVLLFDIFSEKLPRLLLCERDGHYFLSPDNGLLALAFGPELDHVWECFELAPPGQFKDWLHEAGKMANALQTKTPLELQLSPAQLKHAPQHCRPVITADTMECQVIHIDRYENVVINLTKKEFDEARKDRRFSIRFMRDEEITEISTHYYNVREGEKLCRFNSAGYLEIAINRGNAAGLFGLRPDKERYSLYNTIKIFFE